MKEHIQILKMSQKVRIMTKNKTSIYRIVFSTIILCSLIFLLGIDRRSYKDTPSVVYQVYLNGKTVGIIEDEN